ncbi:MAG: response regulator [Deltaproteobacteria bacterium]|nr:response regulator [Deltaproteobacteria bacterium]
MAETFKVLVVEDDDSIRAFLCRYVQKEGYRVLEADNGKTALEVLNKESPQIVLCDIRLPLMDGIEILNRTKVERPDIEFIMMTGYDGDEQAILALRGGALDYIKKPIDLKLLDTAIGRAKEKIGLKQNIKKVFPTLLIAEDEDESRIRLARILEKEDYIVHQARNGSEAIAVFEDNKIDLALLDIKMPHKNGIVVLNEMRAISTDFEAVFLTGFGDEDNAIAAMRSAAFNFLKKPVDIDYLMAVLQKAMEKLTLERALRFRMRDLELQTEITAQLNNVLK